MKLVGDGDKVAQLVRHREPFEYQNPYGDTVKTMEHRAGWDATFSAPKSVSITALVGGDERIGGVAACPGGDLERFTSRTASCTAG